MSASCQASAHTRDMDAVESVRPSSGAHRPAWAASGARRVLPGGRSRGSFCPQPPQRAQVAGLQALAAPRWQAEEGADPCLTWPGSQPPLPGTGYLRRPEEGKGQDDFLGNGSQTTGEWSGGDGGPRRVPGLHREAGPWGLPPIASLVPKREQLLLAPGRGHLLPALTRQDLRCPGGSLVPPGALRRTPTRTRPVSPPVPVYPQAEWRPAGRGRRGWPSVGSSCHSHAGLLPPPPTRREPPRPAAPQPSWSPPPPAPLVPMRSPSTRHPARAGQGQGLPARVLTPLTSSGLAAPPGTGH